MTDRATFAVPDDLLRVGETSTARKRGPTDRLTRFTRAVGLVVAGTAMLPALFPGLAALVGVMYRERRALPRDLWRAGVVKMVGSALAGSAAGVAAASAVKEAQGQGAQYAAGFLLWLTGALLVAHLDLTRSPISAPESGEPGMALDVRNLDFAYGTHQVLFAVSLTVREGEIAALLGTNGAGKSTILRAVAGLDPPVGGAIRIFGDDTTYADAEDLVRDGVALLAGGRMTFPSLTVEENLRVGAYSKADADIAGVYRRFPALASRKQQRAGTLSGGEQQMLALGRVLLTRPRLLLIDELTLGLAPKIVEELIAIVREVNASGTTVLLVEQSVNLALTLAAHSFFLERGEVRFDGPTDVLLKRDDLLRPVFLNEAG